MHLKNLLIEYRPSLKCANIFIELPELISPHELLVEITQNHSHNNNSNQLILFKNIILDLSNYFKIILNSVSCLTIDGSKISFRITTEDLDQFKNVDLFKNFKSPNILELNLNENVDYRIQCQNCMEYLTENIKFQRIRELPSENMDMGEWFCHKHSHGENSVELPACFHQSGLNSTKFTPGKNELFFGQFFVLLNLNIFNYPTNETNSNIICFKCNKSFGEIFSSNNTVKIWNEDIFVSNQSCFKLSNHYDILKFIIINCIRDASCNFHIPLPLILRVVFMTLDKQNNSHKYIIIQIMNGDTKFLKQNHQNVENSNIIDVSPANILKIMYQSTKSDFEFRNNASYHTIDVSNKLFEFVFNYIECNSMFFPEMFRKCQDFRMSFIEIH